MPTPTVVLPVFNNLLRTLTLLVLPASPSSTTLISSKRQHLSLSSVQKPTKLCATYIIQIAKKRVNDNAKRRIKVKETINAMVNKIEQSI